nr:MAG TPA: hypothetical protein [Caudoviricetes sp.]
MTRSSILAKKRASCLKFYARTRHTSSPMMR